MAAAIRGPATSSSGAGKMPPKYEAKGNGNPQWWRTEPQKDPNAMDVDVLTMEERATLLRQGKCFRCKKPGHMAKDCLPSSQKQEVPKRSADPVRFAYTTIKALTKDQREAFTKMVMEDKDEEDF